jgi:ornithine decarboxylase
MLSQETIDEVIAWASDERIASPAFLFSPAAVRSRVAHLRHALGGRISYAVKANVHPWMLHELAPLVDEFNLTNTAHLEAVLAEGIEPSRISFVQPVCTPETVAAVAQRGVTRFVVDDMRGLCLLRAVADRQHVTPQVTLRLRPPDIGESTRSVVRFGNAPEVLRGLAGAIVEAGMTIEALSFFVGTAGEDMPEAMPYRRGIERVAQLHEQLQGDGIAVPAVNIGGGFPGAGQFYQQYPDFFGHMAQELANRFAAQVNVVCEPGRFLSEPSLAMLTRVIADRIVAGRRLVYLDASAYGGLFESSFIEPGGPDLSIRFGRRLGPASPAAVLGPIMDSFDVVKRNALLPALTDGQTLVLPDVGAYAWGYSAQCEGVHAPQVIRLPERLDAEFAAAWDGAAAAVGA